MVRFNSAALCFLVVLATSATASAQGGMVTSGGASFGITSFSSTSGYSADLESADGTDHLFALGLWYRIGATGAESRLGAPDSETYTGNVATLSYTDVDSSGLDIVVTITLTEPVAGQAAIAVSVAVENTSGGSRSVQIFAYLDAEADGDASADSATLTTGLPNPAITVTDSGASVVFRGTAVDSYQVLSFSGLRDLLNDTTATTLDGSGLPFTSGDWTGAYGYSRTLAAGATSTIAFGATASEASVVIPDGGIDAGSDGGTDGGTDAGTDAAIDAATDGGTDGSVVDAATDAGVDSATTDTGPPPADTGTPPGDTGTPPADTGTMPGDASIFDGGVEPPRRGGDGCGCTTASGTEGGYLAIFVVLAGLWMRRRRWS